MTEADGGGLLARRTADGWWFMDLARPGKPPITPDEAYQTLVKSGFVIEDWRSLSLVNQVSFRLRPAEWNSDSARAA